MEILQKILNMMVFLIITIMLFYIIFLVSWCLIIKRIRDKI